MHRFFLPEGDCLALTGAEAHHCRHVLRLQAGDVVKVFDGRGREVECRIAALGKDEVRLEALGAWISQALPCRITLAQAVLKKNMDFIVQKATELGVAAIAPVISDRTIKRPSVPPLRWHEIALDSCKQCGNNWLPEILPSQPLREFLSSTRGFDLKLVASLQPTARPLRRILAEAPSIGPVPVPAILVLIGPEGDFTSDEYAAATAVGCQPLSLGPRVLRADTAALCALSILQYELRSNGYSKAV